MTIGELETYIRGIKDLMSDEKTTERGGWFLQSQLKVYEELLKHKIAIKYFEENGFADIVKNLLSY